MAWYKTGTATFTNGSAAVTGSGTAWVANAAAGQGIVGPDGRTYEVLSVNSDTSLTLSTNYQGSTSAGAAYLLVPTQDFMRSLAAQVATLINDYSTVKNNAGAGKFGDGTLSQPGIAFAADTDTGMRRYTTNAGALVSGGVDKVIWSPIGMTVGDGLTSSNYPLTCYGTGQDLAEITDAGAKGGAIYAQAAAGGAGSGGAVVFGTTFGSQAPFAGFKGTVNDGSANSAGDLHALTRRSASDTKLTLAATWKQNGAYYAYKGLVVTGFEVPPTSGGMALGSGTTSTIYFTDTGQTADNKRAVVDFNANTFSIGYHNDAISAYKLGFRVLGAYASGVTGLVAGAKLYPEIDNSYDLGDASFRWAVVRAGTGTISTSDARTKTEVVAMSAAEIRAAIRMASEIGSFQFLDAVALKGEDKARRHFGLTVQRAMAIMVEEGLQPERCAFICHDSWAAIDKPATWKTIPAVMRWVAPSAVLLADGTPAAPATYEVEEQAREILDSPAESRAAGDIYSFRTDQLLLFIARGQAARQDALEARLAALEAAA